MRDRAHTRAFASRVAAALACVLAIALGAAAPSFGHTSHATRGVELALQQEASGAIWDASALLLRAASTTTTEAAQFERRFDYVQTELRHATMADSEFCGRHVATGDFNGDGRADLVMGCNGIDQSAIANVGNLVVRIRTATSYAAEVQLTKPGTINASDASGSCGFAIATGDLNADGFDDIVTGCYTDDSAGVDAGQSIAWISNGAGGFAAGVEVRDTTPEAGSRCGVAVAIGDVNVDGRGDIIMGCDLGDVGATVDAGYASVAFRNAGNTGFDTGVRLDAAPFVAASSACARGLAIGEFNATPGDDIALGCNSVSVPAADEGVLVVRSRNAANNGYDAGLRLARTTVDASANCGTSVVAADFDADGRDDLAMGCPNADQSAVDEGMGVVFMHAAAPTGFGAAQELTNGSSAAAHCGAYIMSGDFNGDGLADIGLGCPQGDPASFTLSGKVLIYGRAVQATSVPNSGFENWSNAWGIYNQIDGDECGATASGDVHGDGRDDVILGCFRADRSTFTDNGAMVVAVWDESLELTYQSGVGGDNCGDSVVNADLTDDGRADLVFGCTDVDLAGPQRGAVFVRIRSRSGHTYSSEASYTQLVRAPASQQDGEQCGYSVDVGDVTGDGLEDVVTGCRNSTSGGQAGAGVILVFPRRGDINVNGINDDGFGTPIELHPTAPTGSDACGGYFQLEVADLTADGRDDVVAGCVGRDHGGVNDTGGVQVWSSISAPGPIMGTLLAQRVGAAAGDVCGNGVTSGDFNGDGLGDIVAGCTSVGANDYGSVLVYLRNAANTAWGVPAEVNPPVISVGQKCGDTVEAGDVTGDHMDDIVVGCMLAVIGGTVDAGAAVVLPNTGAGTFGAGTVLSRGTPVVGDLCAHDVAIIDANADGAPGVAAGCFRATSNGNAGGGLVTLFERNSTNTGWLAPVEIARLSANGNVDDNCGKQLAPGDINADGRTDLGVSCYRSPVGGFNEVGMILEYVNMSYGNFAASSSVVTKDLDWTAPTRVLDATVTTQRVGVSQSTWTGSTETIHQSLELSNDGGATWAPATSGISHVFATAGGTLQARIAFDNSRYEHRTSVLHDMRLAYTTNTAPATPVTLSPATPIVVNTTTPTLSANFVDPEAGDTGQIDFEVCTVTVAPAQSCGGQGGALISGTSSSTVLASGTNGTWAPTLVAGTTYFWRARATDHGALPSAWTASRQLRSNAQPTVTLLDPAAGSTTADTTPNLQAQFTDTDGDTGQVSFEVCTSQPTPAQTCATAVPAGVLAGSATSAAGLATGATGTGTVAPALALGTYYWRARVTDSASGLSSWTAVRQLVIGAPGMAIGVDAGAQSLSSGALPGTDAVATTTVTVTTNNAHGYTLTATDASDTAGMLHSDLATPFPDWTGTPATPATWVAGVSGYFGLAVLTATGGKDTTRWGIGATSTAFATLKYAGLDNATPTLLNATSGYDPAAQSIVTTYRANAAPSQKAGTYSAVIAYSVIANP